MAKLAIDVALLPPDSIAALAIEINRGLVEAWKSAIVLDPQDCLPHISLVMGCMEESDFPQAVRVLDGLARQCSPLHLRATKVVTSATPGGRKVSHIEIDRSQEIRLLHESAMTKLMSYLTCEVTRDILCSPDDVDEGALFWIANYPKVASFDLFSPHITLGYGETDRAFAPADFTATTLALCHLGDHCTCRKVLYSVELSGKR